jgi:hypothetical protein
MYCLSSVLGRKMYDIVNNWLLMVLRLELLKGNETHALVNGSLKSLMSQGIMSIDVEITDYRHT